MVPKVHMSGALCLMLLLMPACRRSGHGSAVDRHGQNGTSVVLDEKRLTDVSLPIGVQAYDISKTAVADGAQAPGSYVLAATFETDLALSMLVEFYQNDMERLGWKLGTEVPLLSGSFLTYETPRKLCSLLLEDHGFARDVTIFISART